MNYKCTISVPCLSHHCDNKFRRWLAHSSLLFTCEKSTDRNWSPLLICSHRNGPTLEKSLFTLKYSFTSFTRRDWPTPVCADSRPWHRNRWGNISMTMLRVRSKFFRQKSTKLQTHLHVDAIWPIRVHFRWPCLRNSRVWQVAEVIHAVFASSCGIRQS